MQPKVLILGGPTASGKNQVALELLKHARCEFINADSRQIYRDLRIGTNSPDQEDLLKAPHHLYAFLDPFASFSSAEYQERAAEIVRQVLSRGNLPVIIGGTGFYIKALLRGVWPVPARDERLRSRLQSIERRKGKAFLYRMLQRVDSQSATEISENDVYRVGRALEIFFQTGQKRSEFVTRSAPERWPAAKFYLNPDRALLTTNIRRRTEWMFEQGWVDEVRRLLDQYPDFESMPAAASIGYRDIVSHWKGDSTLEECRERIILRTTQYAKRQLTWFRNQDSFAPLAGSSELYKIIDVLQLRGF